MDKEEAMKILKDFHDKSALFSVRTALDTIIPELKVSEDEEVRKIILDQMKCWNEDAIQKNCEIDIEASSKCIAWLEKQGEHANFLNKIQIGDKVTRNEFGVLVNLSQLKRVAKPVDKQDDRLEKQKEDKINTEALLTADKLASAEMTGRLKERKDILENPNKYGLQKQGEHKPVDKVESKFHEGEWIVWQNKCYKVNDKGCGYELIDQNGLSTSLEYGTVDTSARLWDITKDAKDGDVLAMNWREDDNSWEKIIVFKKYHNKGVKGLLNAPCVEGYGNTFKKGELVFNEEVPYYSKTWTCNLHPATKEQRDTLFAKMKAEGYEWDGKTHELKKISQRMVSAEAKEALYDKPTDEEMKELLRTEYEKGRADTIAEIVKKFIEEDSEEFDIAIETLKDAGQFSSAKWLKSLKDRVIPQPKQEWSEEDEKILNNLIDYIKVDDALQYSEKQVVNWLKSLKQRYIWKPSEE